MHLLAQDDFSGNKKICIAEAKLIQNDSLLLMSVVNEREQWIRRRSDKNRQLRDANHDLVGKFPGQVIFLGRIAAIESFTSIGKIKTKNTGQENQDRN